MSHPVREAFPEEIRAAASRVESRLAAMAQAREAHLQEWTREILGVPGKRVRPLLLLTAYYGAGGAARGEDGLREATDAAVALELVHTASLVHDDIMDEARERRGRPSTYAAHGRDAAILVGDYLFTQAFALAATLPKVAMAMTADACRRLCEGQLRETELRAAGTMDHAAYTSVIRDKTAALLAAGCGIGGALAGAPEPRSQALWEYGNAIGHAFQILDDVLDVTGDPEWTGKPAGSDFLAGTMTSPYYHFVARGGHLPARTRDAFAGVRQALFESGAIAQSQLEASAYTQRALLELSRLPASPHRAALERLAELLMERAA